MVSEPEAAAWHVLSVLSDLAGGARRGEVSAHINISAIVWSIMFTFRIAGTLLFYGRLVFEFHAALNSQNFYMVSEPEAAAWHVFNMWRDNLARGVKRVPRFAYIHAYRVVSDLEFGVRSAWEMAPGECGAC